MFSFLKKKRQPEAGSLEAGLRRSIDDLRSEIGDDAVSQGMALNGRINRLSSLNLEFITALLDLTDEITDKLHEQYEGLGPLVLLEVDAFCAAIVITALFTTDLPEEETREVIVIYLDLWTEVAAKNHPGSDSSTLRSQMERLWFEYTQLILRAFEEQTTQIVLNEDSAGRLLVRNVDRLARVQREKEFEGVAAISFKVAISEAIRIVNKALPRHDLE